MAGQFSAQVRDLKSVLYTSSSIGSQCSSSIQVLKSNSLHQISGYKLVLFTSSRVASQLVLFINYCFASQFSAPYQVSPVSSLHKFKCCTSVFRTSQALQVSLLYQLDCSKSVIYQFKGCKSVFCIIKAVFFRERSHCRKGNLGKS